MTGSSPSVPPGQIRVAPRLETDRLILRAHSVGDFADCAAMWRDSQVVKYTIGSEAPLQRTWQRLLAYCGHWSLLGFGYWAVESRLTGRYIGELGFADYHRDSVPDSLQGLPEIGWALAVAAHGQGYATEALHKVIEWGDTHLGAQRTICIIHRENHASVHLARKLGYSTTIRESTDSEPVMLLARSAPSCAIDRR